ncbi:MAG: hypothetical protein WBO55_02250 [Rhizobiaceae bacterium]
MASEPKKKSQKQDDDSALRAVEEALASSKGKKTASSGDPDFDELERKLSEAANDLRGHAVSLDGQHEPGAYEQPAESDDAFPAQEYAPEYEQDYQQEYQQEYHEAPAAAEPMREYLAANDSQTSGLSELVYSLQQRSKSRAYLYALLLSLVWVGVCAGTYVVAARGGRIAAPSSLTDLFTSPSLALFTGFAILPLFMIWVLVITLRRSAEMRLAARTMTEAAVRLLQPEDSASESVSIIGRAVRREIASIGDGVERALARAGELEQLVSSEVGSLERSYADAEVRLRGLVRELSAEREEILNHVDLLRDALSGTHEGIGQEVDQVASRIEQSVQLSASRIVESLGHEAGNVTGNLEGVIGRLKQMLSMSGEELAELITMRTDELDRVLAERSNLFQQGVHERLTGFGTALDGRIHSTFERLTQQQTALDDTAGRIENLVGEQIAKVSADFGNRGATLVRALGIQAQNIDKILLEKADTLTNAVNQKLDGFGANITGHMDNVATQLMDSSRMLSETTEKVEGALLQHAAKFDQSLRERAIDIGKAFTSGRQEITDTIEATFEGIASKTLEAKLQLEGSQESLTSAVDERVAAISAGIDDGHRKLMGELGRFDDRSSGLIAEIERRTDSMEKVVSDSGGKLAAMLDARTDAIRVNLETGQHRIASELDKMDNRSTGLVAEIDKRAERMGTLVGDAGTTMTKMLDERTSAIQRSLSEGHSRLIGELDKMDNRSTGLVSEIDRRAEKLGSIFSEAQEGIGHLLNENATGIRQTMLDGHRLLAAELDKMDNRSHSLMSDIDKRTSVIGHTIIEAGASLTATLDNSAVALGKSLVAGLEKISGQVSRLDDRGSAILGDFDHRTDRLSQVIDLAAEHISQTFDEKNQNIFAAFRTGRDEFLADVDAGSERLLEGLDTKRAEMVRQLGEHIQLTGHQIDSKATALSNLLTERAREINASLGTELVATQRKLEEKTREFSNSLQERVAEISGIITDQGSPFVDQLKNQTENLVNQIQSVGGHVSTELSTLIARLTSSSSELDDNILRAGQSLGALERNISDGAAVLASAVEKAAINTENARQIAEHTATAVGENSEYLVQNVSALAVRFENQGKELRDAAERVTGAQVMLAEALEERREPIERLALDLNARTSSLEQSMNGFSTALNSLMTDMTERATSAGAQLSEEVTSAFQNTLSRLNGTIEELRRSTGEIQDELETTRTQMRRGILELPEEVRQSADTMRRTLVDQITALKELSDIVTRSGKTLDTAPPSRSSSRRAQTEAAQLEPPAPPVTPAYGQPANAPKAPSSPSQRLPQPQRSPEPVAAGPEIRRPQRTSMHQQPGEKTGWVSDLLRRASNEDEVSGFAGNRASAQSAKGTQTATDPRSPLHVVESLNSLSMDIARAIDHEASVDLWERYQRGERNVFTRRLYTLQGQKTFDEIRTKYAREKDFRTAVDRYIADFEKLLEDVARNDRDNIMTQTYLTSDTGKVYTMLAHAAGRLGN